MTAQTVLPPSTSSRVHKVGVAGIATVLVVSGALAGVAGTAEAGKRTGTTSPASVVLNQTAPQRGDQINFSYTFGSYRPKAAVISISCYQSGSWVWGQNILPADTTSVGGGTSPWLSGSATCKADLQDMPNGVVTVLASAVFTVAG